jgi:hypothetical protein
VIRKEKDMNYLLELLIIKLQTIDGLRNSALPIFCSDYKHEMVKAAAAMEEWHYPISKFF